MSTQATYYKHANTASWSMGVIGFAGMERLAHGSTPNATLSRIGEGFDSIDRG